MERREVLKAAAAAAGTAWVAPFIDSAPAAAAACTIKCAFNVTGVAGGAGATVIAVRTQADCNGGTGNKSLLLTFETPANNCPCNATRSVISWSSAGVWSPAPTVSGPASAGSTTFTITLNGLVDGGTNYTQPTPTLVNVTCLDRSGRNVTRQCEVRVTFTVNGNSNPGQPCRNFSISNLSITMGTCTTLCP